MPALISQEELKKRQNTELFWAVLTSLQAQDLQQQQRHAELIKEAQAGRGKSSDASNASNSANGQSTKAADGTHPLQTASQMDRLLATATQTATAMLSGFKSAVHDAGMNPKDANQAITIAKQVFTPENVMRADQVANAVNDNDATAAQQALSDALPSLTDADYEAIPAQFRPSAPPAPQNNVEPEPAPSAPPAPQPVSAQKQEERQQQPQLLVNEVVLSAMALFYGIKAQHSEVVIEKTVNYMHVSFQNMRNNDPAYVKTHSTHTTLSDLLTGPHALFRTAPRPQPSSGLASKDEFAPSAPAWQAFSSR